MAKRSAQILKHPAAGANLRRAYEAAGVNPALASWISAAVPPDVDIRSGLRALRARSREAAQNDDHMGYFLRLVESNVIGHQGITIQSRPRLAGGGYDRRTAERIESAWSEQCERGTWDSSGQLSRVAFDRLAVRTVAMDGEVLARIHEYDPDSPSGFSVELIDPEALDVDYNDQLPNGNLVRMGVEMTRRRRPVAYWLFEESQTVASGYAGYTNARRLRIPAEDIIHVYLPEWVWGTRGVPWARTALRRIKMLGGYEEAAITAARAAALKSSAYVPTEFFDPANLPVGSLEDGQIVQDLTPGGVEQVPYGYDLKTLDWAWPNTEHGVFVREALRGIASGLGVNYNTLANDLVGVNYSSLRQGAIIERELWMDLQTWYIDWVARPIYQRWLAYAIRNGRITRANGQPLPMDRFAALRQATFQGRRWPWVDPLKDMNANREAVNLRTESISGIIRKSGRDPEEVWTELAADQEALERLGIPIAGTEQTTTQPTQPDTDAAADATTPMQQDEP